MSREEPLARRNCEFGRQGPDEVDGGDASSAGRYQAMGIFGPLSDYDPWRVNPGRRVPANPVLPEGIEPIPEAKQGSGLS